MKKSIYLFIIIIFCMVFVPLVTASSFNVESIESRVTIVGVATSTGGGGRIIVGYPHPTLNIPKKWGREEVLILNVYDSDFNMYDPEKIVVNICLPNVPPIIVREGIGSYKIIYNFRGAQIQKKECWVEAKVFDGSKEMILKKDFKFKGIILPSFDIFGIKQQLIFLTWETFLIAGILILFMSSLILLFILKKKEEKIKKEKGEDILIKK